MKKYLSRLIAAFLALTLLAAPASALSVSQALELLEEHYYYEIPEEAYRASTLEELFRLLDPYTEYMTAEEYAYFLELVESTVDMVGIGVEVNYTEDGFLVRNVLSGGGAAEAGLRAGDLIVAVDGISCAPALEEHRQLLLGAEGVQVTVTILRDGQTLDYTVVRRQVYIPNTEITLLDGSVGYVDCNSFGLDTAELFAEGLKKYDSQVNYWVVDLRGNGGGYADAAIEMMTALNGPGAYIYYEDQNGRVTGYTSEDAAVTQKPLILLVDGSSASASELMASGVRDTDRGILIGSRTYGKGVAQAILDSDTNPEYFDGDCMKVTTARFYSAGGNTTDRIGVIPTLLVDDGYAAAVAAALVGGSEDASLLCVLPGSIPFYVDPDTDDDVLCALLEALPPHVVLFCRASANGTFVPSTPAEAAKGLGLDGFKDRWFSDVGDSPYSSFINAMGAYCLLNGTAPGQFSPKGQLTRAQLCVMLARVLNVTYIGDSRFSDVAAGAWYAGGVNAMAELGLVNGVGGGKFDPDSPVTQQQFLTIMGRTARYINFALDAYGEKVEENLDNLPFGMLLDLAPYADWAKSDMAVLIWGLEDVLGGDGTMLYAPAQDIDPSAPTLREEAAAGMYVVLARLEIIP